MSLTVHLTLVFFTFSLLWPSWSQFVAIVVCGHHGIGIYSASDTVGITVTYEVTVPTFFPSH